MIKDDNYWRQKIQFFLHDPIDKVLKIPGHEERAKRIAEAFGETTADKGAVSRSDIIAAWLDRAALPGYSKDEDKSGAIDFSKAPALTHPISGGNTVELDIEDTSTEKTTQAIIDIIEKDTNTNCWDKKQTFLYLFFILKKRLVLENAAGLGYGWERLPADSRIPDHSIWNHCGVVSALGSCFSESPESNVSLVVFSITPVQPFISKTRKLRDHWTASVLLSWLAFKGIVAVMDFLGPDHVIYPSVGDQPLVDLMLKQDEKFNVAAMIDGYNDLFPLKKDYTIASIPNKFVFLAPLGKEEACVSEIEQRIGKAWSELAEMVRQYLMKHGNVASEKAFTDIFTRQIHNYWNYSWSSARLVEYSDRDSIEVLFEKKKFEHLFQTIHDFSKKYSQIQSAYPVSHSLVQTVLAISKTKPGAIRDNEPGEKCPVCGEFEILHDCENSDSVGSEAYKQARDEFWNGFDISGVVLKPRERLCSICAIKRFSPYAVKEFGHGHLLREVLCGQDFPSTTEMALKKFLIKTAEMGLLKNMKDRLVDELHENEPGDYSREVKNLLEDVERAGITLDDKDNYYAILVMDGDDMGDIVNGRNIASAWGDVIHPDLVAKIEDPRFQKGIWEEYIHRQRLLSPAVHAAISESLGAFSLYAVPYVIKKGDGKLVYAGGDDIAAVLPLSTAFDTARKINELYNRGFISCCGDGPVCVGRQTEKGKPLLFFPGGGAKITISGAIYICHDKQPLRGAIEEAHSLLKQRAKKVPGKNALAIKLQKRSGQGRIFVAKWNEINPFADGKCTKLDSFRQIIDAAGEKTLGGSLIYRLKDLEIPIMTIAGKEKEDISEDAKARIKQLIGYEVSHSGILDDKFPGQQNRDRKKQESMRLAGHLAGLMIAWDPHAGTKGEMVFHAETPVIALFLCMDQ